MVDPLKRPDGIDGEIEALLFLDALPGVGPSSVRRVVSTFGTAERALAQSPGVLARVLGAEASGRVRDSGIRRAVRDALARAHQMGMSVIGSGAPEYPDRLRNLADPPPVLFLRGDVDLLARPGVAIVGSRRATARAREVSARLGREVARVGTPVISGLALGVDGAAHRGALDGGGPTIAVLGRGADRPYPVSHASLFQDIVREGLVVSEFLPGTPPLPHHFPRRNRILAALSRAVVVVEAGERSGALITVDHALDLGIDVWAVPGPIDVPACLGSNRLLTDGARPLVSVRDFATDCRTTPGANEPRLEAPLGPDERRVLGSLDEGPRSADEVARVSGLDPVRALAVLSELELDGWISRAPGMRFRRAG